MENILKKSVKFIKAFPVGVVLFFFSMTVVDAATFSFSPSSGYVREGDSFVVDVLIDTEGEESTKAKAVITFDPTLIQLTKAERNNTLYEEYPDDEQTTDNTNGVVMLTGFTQSGTSPLYQTDETADVYARLTFKSIKDGTVTLDWEYSGQDQAFKSVIMITGSPPQNALDSKPSTGRFIIENYGSTPNTGVTNNRAFYIAGAAIIGAGLVFSGGGVVYGASQKMISTNKRTVVQFDE